MSLSRFAVNKYFVAEEPTFNLDIFGAEKWKGGMRGSGESFQSQIRKLLLKIKLSDIYPIFDINRKFLE